MFGAIEVQNSSSAVFNDKEAVERLERQRGNRKEVEGRDDLTVVVQKRQPLFRLGLVAWCVAGSVKPWVPKR
jgi:hypothetical protein